MLVNHDCVSWIDEIVISKELSKERCAGSLVYDTELLASVMMSTFLWKMWMHKLLFPLKFYCVFPIGIGSVCNVTNGENKLIEISDFIEDEFSY